jgi:hypothetical protein
MTMATKPSWRAIADNWKKRDDMIRAMKRTESAMSERRHRRGKVRRAFDTLFCERLEP